MRCARSAGSWYGWKRACETGGKACGWKGIVPFAAWGAPVVVAVAYGGPGIPCGPEASESCSSSHDSSSWENADS